MQPNQVKEAIGPVGQIVGRASQLSQTSSMVPDEIRESLSELSRETEQATQLLASEQDDTQIVACVDRLEKLGDRAWHACAQAGSTVDGQVSAAIKEAHDALSNLKHSLH